jgi:hypothetical protein
MLIPYVVGSVKVGIERIPTLRVTAFEERLRMAIGTMLIPTTRTGLAGVPRVYFGDHAATRSRLVRRETMQLSEGPTMESSLRVNILILFASPNLGGLTNVLEVLKDDSRALWSMLDNPLREDVIMVFSLPKQLTRKFLQVPFSRFASIFLKLASNAEETAFLFLPSSLTQEVTIGQDCWTVKPKVNTNYFIRRLNGWLRKAYNDMEGKFALAVAQVSGTDFATNGITRVLRNGKYHLNTACNSGNTSSHAFPLDPKRTGIITNRAAVTTRNTNRLELGRLFSLLFSFGYLLWIVYFVFLLPRQGRFDGFSRLDTSSTDQLSRKIRVPLAQVIVGALMQFDAVATLRRKAEVSHSVEASSVFLYGTLEDLHLLRSGMQLCDYRSIHRRSVSYIHGYYQMKSVNMGEGAPVPKPQERSACFLPCINDRGLHRRFR